MRNTSLTRREPARGFLSFDDPFFTPFERLLGATLGRPWNVDDSGLSDYGWAPPVDIRETEDAYLVNAELPGMKKEDVQITLENNVLTVGGERRFEGDEKDQGFHRRERAYGKFLRSFALPKRVDSEKIAAKFRDGVLEISVPKMAEARPRQITIQ
ncbi:MAG: Hsp20/alpha crystallin family protein [Acidobacteria bacterium]|nr:Hsp20/alpha crystallin family protein [Acidobacteriota bacterium]